MAKSKVSNATEPPSGEAKKKRRKTGKASRAAKKAVGVATVLPLDPARTPEEAEKREYEAGRNGVLAARRS